MQSNRYSNPSHPPPCNREDKSCFLSKPQVKDGRISERVTVSRIAGHSARPEGRESNDTQISICAWKKKLTLKTTLETSGCGSQRRGLDFDPLPGDIRQHLETLGAHSWEEEGCWGCLVGGGYHGYCYTSYKAQCCPVTKDIQLQMSQCQGWEFLVSGFYSVALPSLSTRDVSPAHLEHSPETPTSTLKVKPQGFSSFSLVLATAWPRCTPKKAHPRDNPCPGLIDSPQEP